MSFQKKNNFKDSSNQLLENVFEGEKLLAIILRTAFKQEGIDFFTPPDFSGFRVVGGPNQSISNSWVNGKRSFSKKRGNS